MHEVITHTEDGLCDKESVPGFDADERLDQRFRTLGRHLGGLVDMLV